MKRFIAIALVVAAAVLAAAADRQSAAQQSQPGPTNAPIMMPSLAARPSGGISSSLIPVS